VAGTVLAGLGGGGTILLHDSDCTSPAGSAAAALAALPQVLDACEVRGLRVGTLAEHWPGPGTAGSSGERVG
jgi:peptidoglycan-N-acetylglucosamine deacetylase